MAAKSIILSVNDYPNATDYLNLVDGNNYICPPDDGFSAPPPAVHRYHSRTKGTLLTTEDFRTVTLKLQVFGGAGAGSADTLLANIAALEKKGRQARLYSGPTPRGMGPVSLAVRFSGATNYTYFDVQDILVTADMHVYGPVNMQTVTVMLTCLPWARGAVIQDALSPIIVNGANGYLFRAGVMGDTDAIAQLQIVDNALSSQFINRIHVGRMAGDGLRVSDFTPVNTNLTPISPATTIAGTGVLSGTAARLATSAAFTPVCTFAQPSGNYQSGFNAHAYAVVRDGSAILAPPTNIAVTQVQQLIVEATPYAGTWSVQMTSTDASGNESPTSTAVSITLTSVGNAALKVTWTPNVNATYVNIYLYNTGNAFWYNYWHIPSSLGNFTIYTTTPIAESTIIEATFAPPTGISLTAQAAGTGSLPAGTYTVYLCSANQIVDLGPPSTGFSVAIGTNAGITITATGNASATYNYAIIQHPDGTWEMLQVSASTTINYLYQQLNLTAAYPAGFALAPPWTQLSAPTGLSASTQPGGTLVTGTYTVNMAAVDANSHVGVVTGTVTVSITTGNQSLKVNWTPPATANYVHLNVQAPSGTWYRFIVGGTATTFTISSLAGVAVSSVNTIANASLIGGVAIAGAAGQYLNGPPKLTQLAGGRWELLYLGVFPFTPMHGQEGQNKPSWIFRVQARGGTVSTPNVDVAGLVLIPDDEPHLLAEYRGLAIPAAYTWILDDPRDRYVSGGLQSAGNYVGAVRAAGELRLAPGNNLVPIICEGPGGIFDSTNIRYQAALRYVPLYAFMRGADSDQSVLDLFDRANNASSLGIADSGQTYNVTGGTFGVENNHFYVNTVTTSNKAFAYINAAYANGVIRCTLVNVGAGVSYLVFRLLDTSHYYALFASAASGYQLYSNVAGTLTNIASNAQPAQSGDQIVVTLNGTTVSVSVNSIALSSLQNISIPNNSTAVGVGLGGNNAASETWNSWSMSSA